MRYRTIRTLLKKYKEFITSNTIALYYDGRIIQRFLIDELTEEQLKTKVDSPYWIEDGELIIKQTPFQ